MFRLKLICQRVLAFIVAGQLVFFSPAAAFAGETERLDSAERDSIRFDAETRDDLCADSLRPALGLVSDGEGSLGESTSSGLDVGAVPGLDSGFNADKDVDVDGDTGSDGSGGSQVESGLPDADRIGDLASSGEGSSFDAVEHGESASSSSTDDACRPVPDGVYLMQSRLRGDLVVGAETSGGAGFDSSSVALFASDMSDGQKLRISYDEGVNAYRISIEGTDLVLSALGDENANGRTLRFLHDEGDPLQRWLIEGSESDAAWMELHPSNDTKASVDVANAEAAPGAGIQLWESNHSAAQHFRFVEYSVPSVVGERSIDDGVYVIGVGAGVGRSGCALDVPGASCSNGVRLQIWSWNDTPAQRFRFSFDDATGYYRIENLLTKKALAAETASILPGVGLVQEEPSKDDLRQAWAVFQNDDGSMTLVNAASGLSVTSGGSSSGSALCLEAVGSGSQSFNVVPVSSLAVLNDGTYRLQSGLGLLVVDVASAGTSNGANLQLWSYNGTAAQTFVVTFEEETGYYLIEASHSGKRLDVCGAGDSAGVNVQTWEQNDTYAQRWMLVKDGSGYQIRSALAENYVLDVQNASTSPGSNIQMWYGNGTEAQRFSFLLVNRSLPASDYVEDGVYILKSSADPSKAVDVESASRSDGANVQLWEANGTMAQRFEIKRGADGFYRVRNVSSGAALDAQDGMPLGGANVQQWSYNERNANQRWAFYFNDDGSVSIVSASTGLNLDIPGGSAYSGANVQLWEGNGSLAQSFVLERSEMIADGLYSITSVLGASRAVDVANASRQSGASLWTWDLNNSTAQKFFVSSNGDGTCCIEALCSGLLLAEGPDGLIIQTASNAEPANLSHCWIPRLSASGGGLVFENAASGRVMDVRSASMANGALLQTWAANDTEAQSFYLTATELVSDGMYEISCAADGRLLDVSSGSFSNGANVQLWTRNDTGAQKWNVRQAANGCITIHNVKTGKALDVYNYGAEPGTNVQTWASSDGNTAQMFEPIPTGDGRFYLKSACSDLYLDADGGGGWDGANVQVYTSNQSDAQKFTFTLTSYSFTMQDVRESVDTADGSWYVTSFGGYEMSEGVRSSLQSAVDSVRADGYDAGFVMVDIKTGQGVACNPYGSFYSASTIKGPYVASIVSMDPSTAWSWGATMEQTIRVSSNEGYEALRNAFGGYPMSLWCMQAGVDPSMASTWYPYYSARDLVKLWSVNYEFFNSSANGGLAGSWYTSSWNSMIHEDLGYWYDTQTKPGWTPWSYLPATNDAGIVWAGDRPYLVAILTSVPSNFSYLHDIIWAIDGAHNEMVG